MTIYTVEKVLNKDQLSTRAAQLIAKFINSSLQKKDRIQISLCGGSTPSAAYKNLSNENLPWNRVDVFLGDERWVDLNDQSSNALMIRNTLLSDSPGSKACFHPVVTTELSDPEKSAEAYAQTLKTFCKSDPPSFDLMLLGLGDDGHTASLFPYSSSLDVSDSYTTVGYGKGQHRITLTHTVLSSAKKIIFLISGSSKQKALKRLIDPSEDCYRTPAKFVKSSTEILVLADLPACELI